MPNKKNVGSNIKKTEQKVKQKTERERAIEAELKAQEAALKEKQKTQKINENRAQQYMKLFGIDNLHNARQQFDEQAEKIIGLYDETFADYKQYEKEHVYAKNEQTEAMAENLKKSAEQKFLMGYYLYCKEQLENAWTVNLNRYLHGESGVRTTEQVTEEFILNMRSIDMKLLSKEGGARENPVKLYEIRTWAFEGTPENDIPSIYSQWKENVLDVTPKDKVSLAKAEIYKVDATTGKKPSVATAMARVRGEFDKRFNDSYAADYGKCRNSVVEMTAMLRAVEQKHATHGFFWRLRNLFNDNYKLETQTIETMRQSIGTAIRDINFRNEKEFDEVTDADFEIKSFADNVDGGKKAPENDAQNQAVAQDNKQLLDLTNQINSNAHIEKGEVQKDNPQQQVQANKQQNPPQV